MHRYTHRLLLVLLLAVALSVCVFVETLQLASPAIARSVADPMEQTLANITAWASGLRSLLLHVGTDDAPTPPLASEHDGVLCFEAQPHMVERMRAKHGARASWRMLNVLVSNETRLTTVTLSGGQTSMASRLEGGWHWRVEPATLPAVSLGRLLAAIPRRVAISALILDVQGYDLSVLRSAPPAELARVPLVIGEVTLNGTREYTDAPPNDLDDWRPAMARRGFELVSLDVNCCEGQEGAHGRVREGDAVWMSRRARAKRARGPGRWWSWFCADDGSMLVNGEPAGLGGRVAELNRFCAETYDSLG